MYKMQQQQQSSSSSDELPLITNERFCVLCVYVRVSRACVCLLVAQTNGRISGCIYFSRATARVTTISWAAGQPNRTREKKKDVLRKRCGSDGESHHETIRNYQHAALPPWCPHSGKKNNSLASSTSIIWWLSVRLPLAPISAVCVLLHARTKQRNAKRR